MGNLLIPASVVDDQARLDIGLMNLRHVIDLGLPIIQAVDSIADEYEDETGIDTVTSVNELYDATGDFYKNEQPVSANLLTGGTASASSSYTTYVASKAFDGAEAVDGDRWLTATLPAQLTYDLGSGNSEVFEAVRLVTYATPQGQQPTDFTIECSNDGSAWTVMDTQTGVVWDTDTGVALTGHKTFTFSNSTAYRYIRVNITDDWASSSSATFFEFEAFTLPSFNEMTLISETFTAESQPEAARLVLLHQPVDSVTYNTDFTAEVSRDDGTTWELATLSDEGEYSSGVNILSTAEIDLSGQPAGTSMRYRLKTLNEKEQQVHAAYLQWS